MTTKSSAMTVRKSMEINAPQEHVFAVFTEQHGTWWPLVSHHIGKQAAQTAIIEPKKGGRWYERAADGSECDWGRVLVWEPPHRIVLTWDIGANWQYDPTLGTEVEVQFKPKGPDTTVVELEHRYLENYGDMAGQMVGIFSADGGWGGILQRFAEAATRR